VKQLQLLCHCCDAEINNPRRVPAGPVEAGDEASFDRVYANRKTIGIVAVAAFATGPAGVPIAAITAT
jgi:hypothetical protein